MTDDEQKKIFAKNLSYYVYLSGKQQKDIAKELGFNQKTFNGWCNALSVPTMGKIQALADYFGIQKTDLIDEKNYKSTQIAYSVRIPVLGHVAAGIPLEMIDDIIDTEEIPEDMANGYEFFGLRIKGDSMEPRIFNGDVVIVRKQEDAESGEIVIATINGSDATCKRLMKYISGIQLISLNSKYEPQMFTNKEIEEMPVRIIGKVVEVRGKLRF